MSYSVVRTDLMSGTKQPADLVSVKYMGTGETPTAIENGCVVKLFGLIAGEREIWKGITPAVNDSIDSVVIIASPEVMYDERKRNLNEFINPAGTACRGLIPRPRNMFSVTKDGLIGKAAPAVGDIVELAAGTKLNVVDELTAGSTRLGTIAAVENTGRYTYYTILVYPSQPAPALAEINITTAPTKTTYSVGDALDLTAMVVTATYSDESTAVITQYTTSPAEGAVLATTDTAVTVSYTEAGVTKTDTQAITVS